MSTGRYLLSNDAPESMDRFTAFTTLFDPATFRHLDGLGLAPGWRCWEVGAGGTSVVTFLSERVGPAGHVLASDIDVSWAVEAAAPNVEVVEHDVAADPALQPLSCPDEIGPPQELANRIRRGFRSLMAERDVDLAYGRTLPRRLRAAGLVQVGADAAFPVSDPACNDLEAATIALIRDQLLDHGIATAGEIAQHLENVAAGLLDLAQPPMISCWGRRPPSA